MSLPIFSFIYIVILIIIFLYSSNLRTFYINNVTLLFFLEIIASQGYFIQFSSQEYYIDVIQLYIVFLLSLILLACNLNGRRHLIYAVFIFLGISLSSVLYQAIFPYDGYILPAELNGMDCSWDTYVAGKSVLYKYNFDLFQNASLYRRLCMYTVVIYTMKINISFANTYRVLTNLIRCSFFIVLYGYFEMILKNLLNMPMEVYKFSEFFFGASVSTYTWESAATMVDGSYRLQGVTREPSHYVFSLLIISLLILISMKYHKVANIVTPCWYYVELLLILILMPMTGGMSSIWCIFSLILSYIIISLNKSFNYYKMLKFGFCALLGLGILFLMFKFLLDNSDFLLIERFSRSLETLSFLLSNPNVLQIIGMDGSTLARFTSIIVCAGNWLDNPFWGLGYGITKAHDFTITMLVGNGLLGCSAWYHLITTSGNVKKRYDHLLLLFIFCIMLIPIGSLGGWYTSTYFMLLAEATALYRNNGVVGSYSSKNWSGYDV